VGDHAVDRGDRNVGDHSHFRARHRRRTNLTFIQLAFGYLIGRIGVAVLLLPGYSTARRRPRINGSSTVSDRRAPRRVGDLPDHPLGGRRRARVRDCHPLAIITHWSLPAGILATGW